MLELCQGTLADVINGTYKGAPLPSQLEVLHQITDGLGYIHGKDIIHRDLKPNNILISKDSAIKLSDFGFCKELDAQSASSISGLKGTMNWMAPELHEIDEQTGKSKQKATKETDIFATGLIFFVFLTKGVHPFGERIESIEIPVNIKNNNRINSNINSTIDLLYKNIIILVHFL